MNLLLLERTEITAAGEVLLDGPRARHLLDVLKVREGSVVRAGIVDGPIGSAEVLERGSDRVLLSVRCEGPPPPRPAVDLLLALPRPKVLRRLWPQLAALGVGTVVLTNANRVERYYFDSHIVREEEIRRHLLEGLSQAKDTRLPRVHVTRAFKPLVEDRLETHFGDARRLVADPLYERSAWDELSTSPGRVVLALGPEGGWTPYERALLEANGFTGIGLGPRTLRLDTATIALVSLAHEARRARYRHGRAGC